MNSKYQELCQFLTLKLNKKYSIEHIQNISNYILKSDYLQNKIGNKLLLNLEHNSDWSKIIDDILIGRPIQYCLGESYFFDLVLCVDERVLIPRPETEELVDWCTVDYKSNPDSLFVLDIGTGSGAIAVQLAKKFPQWQISALDKYQDALDVATINANKNKAKIQFIQLDFLTAADSLNKKFDIIISNPPYILEQEKEIMSASVLEFEPHTALFAEDSDPLIFYKKIAEFGKSNLNSGGKIYCELNEFRWEEIFQIFKENKYSNIEIREDLQGKKRMIRADKT